jgi:hypothetical protein
LITRESASFGRPRKQRDLMVGSFGISTEKNDAGAPVLLGDAQSERITIKSHHFLQIVNIDPDVS